MARECCANCIYCQYSPREDKHIGKSGDMDFYCTYHQEWLGGWTGGRCRDYVES